MAEKTIIGLTGNIGTGKSLVLRMLQELGVTPIDADTLVHRLMAPNTPVYQAIINEFGKFVLNEDGTINRARLGKIVFGMPQGLTKLEAITHPAVRQEILKRVEKAPTQVVAIEAIKLFETDLHEHCHAKWVVVAAPEVQYKRLVARRKMPPDQAQQRIKAQPPQQQTAAKADVVIDNSGEVAKTWAAVRKHFTALLEARAKTEAMTTAPSPPPAPEVTTVMPVAPTKDIPVGEIVLRRAKRGDLEAISALAAAATKGAITPSLNEMMEALFSRAYLLATSGDYVVGAAGWQTENLIAGIQDFYVLREDLWETVGKQILDKIHEEADSLSCEVSLMFVLDAAGAKPVEFFESQGYEQIEAKKLDYMWRDAALEWQPEKSILLYKKLRERRIMVPM